MVYAGNMNTSRVITASQVMDFYRADGSTERFDISTPETKNAASVNILKILMLNGFIPTPGDPIRAGVPTCDDRVKGEHQLTAFFLNAVRILNGKPVLEVVLKRNEDYTLEAWQQVMDESGFRDDPEYVVDDASVCIKLTAFEVLQAVPNVGRFVTVYDEEHRPALSLVS